MRGGRPGRRGVVTGGDAARCLLGFGMRCGCGRRARPKLRMLLPSPGLPTRSSRSLPHPVAFPCSRRLPLALPAGRGVGASTRGAHNPVEAPCKRRWLPGLLAAAAVVLSSSAPALQATPPPEDATLEDVPQTLSGGGGAPPKKRIQRPKSREAERCTGKCVGTCIQGGAGSPGEGPFNVRRPLVVFKPGFRSRNYCLVECSDICNLIKDGDDGP